MFLFLLTTIIPLISGKIVTYKPNDGLHGQNPNGPWSFGHVLAGDHLSFQLYTEYTPNVYGSNAPFGPFVGFSTMAGVEAWFSIDNLNNPFHDIGFIIRNTNIDTFAEYNLDYQMAPGQLLFHPGSNNTRACIRFTVPSADIYDIHGIFFTTAAHAQGCAPSADIHLSINDVDLRSLWLKRNTGLLYFPQMYLNEGDYVQFEVGFGENRDYSCDGVQLNVTLTAYNH